MKRNHIKTLALALCLTVGATITPVSGDRQSAAATVDTAAQEELKALISKTEYATPDSVKEAVRLSTETIGSQANQEELFVVETLAPKNASTCKTYDLNKDGSPELFVLYANKKLEVYEYTEQMVVDGKTVKPLFTMKNVKEVRKGSTSKGSFFIKQTKGSKSTYTGCTYKAGSVKKGKTISPKKFKKQKKLKFSAPIMARDWLYDCVEFIIIDKETSVRSLHVGGVDKYGRIVIHRDKEPEKGMPSYRIFGEIYDTYDYRMVLGQDEEKDFNRFFEKQMSPVEVIPFLGEFYNGNPIYAVTGFTPANGDKTGYYTVAFADEDGSEADFFLRFNVETVNGDTRLQSIESVTSTGLVDSRIMYYYGDEAWDVDGEIYTPGLENECFPSEEFLKQSGQTELRSMKVAYPDKTVEIKTFPSVKFIPYSWAGVFSVPVDGQTTEFHTLEFLSKEMDILNPPAESGYGDAAAMLTWKPSEG